MKRKSSAGAILVALSVLVCWPGAAPSLEAETDGPPIDVVIALDVSGTMKGLIDATHVKIWEIVNDLAEAEPTPQLRVALITFGNQRASRSSGGVRVETDLTGDLDLVSERLFSLRTRGAEEMVGRVLKTALEELTWSDDEQLGLKLLFIAGNESADQDQEVGFREMSEQARDEGLFVSAIYCGAANQADAETWKEMAELAEGKFSTINHHARAMMVETPFDHELAELGYLLNETFVPVGKKGSEEKRARARQDKNARSLGLPVAATRAQTKGSALYSSPSDLVSRYRSGDFDPGAEEGELPRHLRRMTPDERILYLQEMAQLQDEIRDRIAGLGAERRRFVSEQMARPGIDDSRSFDRAVRGTIREKAEEAGFTFPER